MRVKIKKSLCFFLACFFSYGYAEELIIIQDLNDKQFYIVNNTLVSIKKDFPKEVNPVFIRKKKTNVMKKKVQLKKTVECECPNP